MLIGYFDDSGKESNANSPYVCMAGYLADLGWWDDFTRRWQRELLKHHIRHVHMRDIIPIQGEYAKLGWNTDKRNSVLGDFIKVIRETGVIGFGVGVDANYWREIRSKLPQGGSVQTFCFMRVLRMVVERLKIAAPRDFLMMVFDTDREFASARFNSLSDIWAIDDAAKEYVASITFAKPVVYAPLQAADLLVWETRKELMQKVGGYESTPRWRELFAQLTETLPALSLDYQSEFWDKEEIDKQLLSK